MKESRKKMEMTEIEVPQTEATDFLMTCLDEWQSYGGDNTEMFEAMVSFIDAVKAATVTKH